MVDVSETLYFFSLGEGKGESRGDREGGQVDFLLKMTGGRGLPRGGGEGRGGREGVCGAIGGGAKYFFSGPKCPPSYLYRINYHYTQKDFRTELYCF